VLPPKVDPVAGATGTMPYPLLPPLAFADSVMATVYVALGATVARLGIAVTVAVVGPA
jgi:hypothetical protein